MENKDEMSHFEREQRRTNVITTVLTLLGILVVLFLMALVSKKTGVDFTVRLPWSP